MKKTKNVRVDRFAVLFFILLGFFIGSPTVSARESSITFTLHNRMFESEQMPSISQNDGMASPDNFQEAKGLNGVTFAIYDVSDEFYKLRSEGSSIEDAQRKLAQKSDSGKILAESVTKTVDGEEGIASFRVSDKDEQGRDAVYRFAEIKSSDQVKEKSAPFVVVLPVTDSSNHKLTTIHLYPKSEQKIPAALTLTKKVENKQTDFADGDKVPYLITTTIPENINEIGTYTIKDTADPQLWLEPETIDLLIVGEKIHTFHTQKTKHGFVLSDSGKDLSSFAGKKLTIRYQMSLKENSEKTTFDNEVRLTTDNQTVETHLAIQTGGKQFVKVDGQTKQRLADAQFLVKRDNQYLAQENGTNHWVAKDDPRATIFTSGKDGTFSVHGLSFGSYELVEIKPPKGYVWSPAPILFEVEEGSYDPLHPIPLEIINEPEANRTNNGKTSVQMQTNGPSNEKSGGSFPKTNEEMLGSFSILGLLLVLSTGTAWFYKKQQKGNNRREIK
ncbi:SpaH/EbpB family LPXTG-anchored major pilin [Enterococcus faecium]|uniref:SpaH/EbpB family LPXTG-anchored major pilin n=1 Tax=Enterococcus faecium TaxID=1352 RepID=UPI00111DE7C4|nr:SpaH/EbpB family LPXTG-anchored major pilin [Enterococcus faecium]TNX28670.1 isopeptide-forming domain-containing fimbrial protein [Enterococcus faecium]